MATWSPVPGKTKQKKFSINKYGEEKAFNMAVQARMEALEKLDGYFNPGMSHRKSD
jgi:hypothetical protein